MQRPEFEPQTLTYSIHLKKCVFLVTRLLDKKKPLFLSTTSNDLSTLSYPILVCSSAINYKFICYQLANQLSANLYKKNSKNTFKLNTIA